MSERERLWIGDHDPSTAAGFGAYGDKDEYLHPEASIPGDSLTETWAYMFYVPEARISGMVHIWVHPNLGVVTAGIGAWRGHKGTMISAELMDVPTFASGAELGNGRKMSFSHGLHVEILEPFKKIIIHYEDKARGNALDLVVTDFSPPMMRGSCNHFDQSTWNKGVLKLRGQTFAVDGIGMRDRSWGGLRTESPVSMPPITWLTGTFVNERISWHIAGFDDPDRDPDWKGLFNVQREEAIHDGWVWRDGVNLRLKNGSITTRRDRASLRPVSHDLKFTDASGRDYHITGNIVASLPWTSWSNMIAWICCTEWTLDGLTGYGDTQEVHWNDYQHWMRTDQDVTPIRP